MMTSQADRLTVILFLGVMLLLPHWGSGNEWGFCVWWPQHWQHCKSSMEKSPFIPRQRVYSHTAGTVSLSWTEKTEKFFFNLLFNICHLRSYHQNQPSFLFNFNVFILLFLLLFCLYLSLPNKTCVLLKLFLYFVSQSFKLLCNSTNVWRSLVMWLDLNDVC